jgi:hypothetical protein
VKKILIALAAILFVTAAQAAPGDVVKGQPASARYRVTLTGGTGTCPATLPISGQTLAGTGAAISVDVTGYATAMVTASGTFTSTTTWTITDSTLNYVELHGFRATENTSIGAVDTTATAAGKWRMNVNGERAICFAITAFTSGTIQLDVELTTAPLLIAPVIANGKSFVLPVTMNVTNGGTASGNVAQLVGELPSTYVASSAPAVNTQATVSTGACATCKRNVTSCSGSIRTVAAQTGALQLQLLDGATVVMQEEIGGCAINTQCRISLPLPPGGVVQAAINTQQTCQWTGVPATGNFEIANITYRNVN